MEKERWETLMESIDEARGDVMLLRQCVLGMMERRRCSQLELDTLWRLSDYLNQHLWDIRAMVRRGRRK